MARRELVVEPRHVLGKKVRGLRREGVVPGNIYGHNVASLAVQLDGLEFQKALRAMTANEVIDLKVNGERAARPAVIHEVQRDALTGGILHADFYQVSLREKMRASVPIVLVGTSVAAADLGGILLQQLDSLDVEALPLDIPTRIEADVSVLEALDTSIHVRDLPFPANVTVLTDGDVAVASVSAPRITEEEAEAAAAEEEAAAAPAAEEEAPAPTAEAETKAE